MNGRPSRILVLGSLPLAGPWNGADKMLARTIVHADRRHEYVVQTGLRETWPPHAIAVRQHDVQVMPDTAARIGALRYLVRSTAGTDLIHVVATVQRSSVLPARVLRAWARATGRPVVHTLPAVATERIDRAALPGDVTVALSKHTAERLRAAGVEHVVGVFPPLPLGDLRPRDPSERLRRQHRLGPLPVLYAAHLDAGSGIAEAMRALAALPPALSEATLVLAVRWRSGQDVRAELLRLRGIADAVGVTGRVRWLTRVADMRSLISTCAVSVLVPERLAGKMDLPLVLLESLALERPIIVADQAPINETLLGGGLAVPFGDVDALADALAALLGDDARRAALGAAGRRGVVAAADPRRIEAAYEEVYDAAAALGRRGRPATGEPDERAAAAEPADGVDGAPGRLGHID